MDELKEELFMVEYVETGESVDDGDMFCVYDTRAIAQDAMESNSEGEPLRVVRFVREPEPKVI